MDGQSYSNAAMKASAAYGSPETFSRSRLVKETEFTDLRVDSYDRCASKSILGVSKAPLLPSKSRTTANTSSAAYHHASPSLALMMPSATPNGLKRCQSASTIRKKLQHAMEQSAQTSSCATPEQIAALRSLSATAITTAKPTPKSLLSHTHTHNSSYSKSQTSVFAPTPASSQPQHQQHYTASNQHTRVQTDHSPYNKSSNNSSSSSSNNTAKQLKFSTMFASEPSTGATSSYHPQKRPTSASASSSTSISKATSIQLEVELAERLNAIERSKLMEKAESRFKASQRAFDHVIHQDEPFGRILANIRDEYDAYVAFLTHQQHQQQHQQYLQQPGNQSHSNGFGGHSDVAHVRQENAALKKSCAAMQRELEVLQASILASAIHKTKTQSQSHSHTLTNKIKTNAAVVLQPEDDSMEEEEDDEEELLSGVLLLPLEEATKQPLRPNNVPQLDFSCLSPYNEEEEEEEDEQDLDDHAFEENEHEY